MNLARKLKKIFSLPLISLIVHALQKIILSLRDGLDGRMVFSYGYEGWDGSDVLRWVEIIQKAAANDSL